jgi:geranylgeranyl pyrophosphate synthase
VSQGPIGVVFADVELERSVRAALDAVEHGLRSAVRSDDQVLDVSARHLLDAGGKRFRPLVTILASHFGDPHPPEIVTAGVVVELTHLATLYHDDVMDEALVRRGATSANARWGNTVAILTGDFLFARASDLLADLGPAAVRLQARTFERLVAGQIRETVGPGEADPIEHYLQVLADKTGSLIATSAQFGAEFAGVDRATVAVLRDLGEQIGVAFQLSDDILDITSESSESGKTPGTDLREGIPTLPVLYALRSTDPAGARLRELVSGPLADDTDHAEALARLRESTALAEARATLREYAEASRSMVARLPARPARDALEALTEVVVARTG